LADHVHTHTDGALGEAGLELADEALAPFGFVLLAVRAAMFRWLSSTKPLDCSWSFAIAVDALKIPRAIRLIRCFNIFCIPYYGLSTRDDTRLHVAFLVSTFPKKEGPRTTEHAAGLFLLDESWLLATGVGRNPSRALNYVSIS
jgi:hypothetical protein